MSLRGQMNNAGSGRRATALVATIVLASCGDSPFQVIEEVSFDSALAVDLSQMERLASGVYRLDVVVGDGLVVIDGSVPTVFYEGWLADGTKFGEGTFAFVVGQGQVLAGFEEGVFGMREGGVRRIIIPPALAYGDRDQETIPAGSVLIFDVTLDTVEVDDDQPAPAVVGISR